MSSLRRSGRIQDRVQSNVAKSRIPATVSKISTTKQNGPGSKKRGRTPEPALPARDVDARGAQAAQFAVPTTPAKRRARPTKTITDPTPVTPTPAKVDLIVSAHTPPVPITSRVSRPAGLHVTNASLSTPGGSKVVAYLPDASPSKAATIPRPSTTTDTLLEEACAHLVTTDPTLKPLVEKHTCQMFTPAGLAEEIDPFESLASGIISQQVSGAAARSIKAKFIALFPAAARFPPPTDVAATSLETLRTAGLSQRKAEYIKGLAEKFVGGELNVRMLATASDEEVIERLVEVRGLGRWSAEMFACFGLRRMDIFAVGDLGVQRGLAIYLGKDVNKLRNKGGKWKYCSEQEMLTHSAKFAPYRTLFMWYLWRLTEVDVDAMS
ncbi:DNA glycosylase [Eremomyces bilateralis CBS 781.70]|uniref:DNA glycosylase n=1 Tax=Eremomyces bilateralis CBS 781.70 TaxID=1392243 RepID=A0A6G1G9A8_9PEZI|nr:DNA glycosylase [Eremomyces bilateralis CBS 781.70]KAF1814603.1 DNA glycosylase [Eremomyces bilateralis CBS 781.70]